MTIKKGAIQKSTQTQRGKAGLRAKIGNPKSGVAQFAKALVKKPKVLSQKLKPSASTSKFTKKIKPAPLLGAANKKKRSSVASQNILKKSYTKIKGIGYFATGSLVMALSLLCLTQKELKVEQDTHPVSLAAAPQIIAPTEAAHETMVSGPLADEFKLALPLSMGERIKFWSTYIMGGQEHQDNIAGLVKGIAIQDVAPIVPPKYDCTTFVETVSALSRSNSPDQFVKQLLAIRYKDSNTQFYARNHLPEIDWIPNNEKAGILNDVTFEVAKSSGLRAQVSHKEINRNHWLAERSRFEGVTRGLASVNEANSEIAVEAQVPYINLSQLREAVGQIPDGSVVNFVHNPDRRHTGVITHQAFLIHENGSYYLRHASREGLIRTSELFHYIDKLHKLRSSWPVVGINLNQIQNQVSDSSSSTNRFNETM